MTNKIWDFADKGKEEKTPYEYLFDYSIKVKDDTGGIIEGLVTEMVSDSTEEIVYALYLVVPELRNYSIRLIEVIQSNAFTPYPVTMKLFGKAAGNIVEKPDVSFENFEKELLDFIQNPLTKLILRHLKTHLEIKKEYEK
jgi:hypothetical protein